MREHDASAHLGLGRRAQTTSVSALIRSGPQVRKPARASYEPAERSARSSVSAASRSPAAQSLPRRSVEKPPCRKPFERVGGRACGFPSAFFALSRGA